MSESADKMAKERDGVSGNFAAALSYRENDAAPMLVAKGDGLVADEIVRRALEAGVPVHQSRELALLVRDVPLDYPIPPQLYRVIAELLAWVYQIEHRPMSQPALSGPDV